MGYTVEKCKNVIWTKKVFESYDYPFNDEGENVSYFYKNIHDNKPFFSCFARLPEDEKIKLVAEALQMENSKIVLRSKKSHHSKKSAK